LDLSALAGLERDAVRCPYALYGEARSAGVVYDESFDAWVVGRYADAVEVLRNGAAFSSHEVLGRPLPAAADESQNISPLLLVNDDPIHGEKRALVARAFTPRQIRAWEPAVTELCVTLAERMLARPDPDFVRDFAAPLPIRVIISVLGVPSGDADAFRHWSEELTRSLGGHDGNAKGRDRAAQQFRVMVTTLLDDPASLPADSVLAVIAAAESEGELTRSESVRLVMELIIAGNITTTDHLANSMVLLAAHPEIWAQLGQDRSLIARFVEESLRLEAPVQGFYRRSTCPVAVGGTDLAAGSRMLVLYGSANRDPSRFEAPEHLRLDRDSGAGHVAFGFGAHTCIGAPLARLESRVAIEVLLDRVEAFELIDPAGVDYLPSYINHGPTSLPFRTRTSAPDVAHGGVSGTTEQGEDR
jgi:cytochrome P450